jgi:hypothetical protein
METAVALNNKAEEGTFSIQGFVHAERVAVMLADSTLVPDHYRKNVANCLIALEMSNRIGASPMMVMQHLHIIKGRPSWSSPFIIASINTCGRFTKLNFRKSGEGDSYGYEAVAKDKKTNEELVGPKVTWAMVKAEGWLAKDGSKWKTMPELMFQYRAAAFFGRLHAPDVLMGMQTSEEVIDAEPVIIQDPEETRVKKEEERVTLLIKQAKTTDALLGLMDHITTQEQRELFDNKMKALS